MSERKSGRQNFICCLPTCFNFRNGIFASWSKYDIDGILSFPRPSGSNPKLSRVSYAGYNFFTKNVCELWQSQMNQLTWLSNKALNWLEDIHCSSQFNVATSSRSSLSSSPTCKKFQKYVNLIRKRKLWVKSLLRRGNYKQTKCWRSIREA